MNPKQGQKALGQQILSTVKQMFYKHSQTVARMNSEQKDLANSVFDSKEPQFLKLLSKLREPLATLIKDISANSKTRKEKKNSYLDKLRELSNWIQSISKKKALPIKINDFILELVNFTTVLTTKVTGIQQNYLNAGAFSCGSVDHKGLFQVTISDLTEHAYLLKNIVNLESKSLQGPVELYIPVKYQQSAFSNIYQELQRVWPAPIIKKEEKAAEKEVTIVKVREQDRLREAHQKLLGLGRSQDIDAAIKIYEQQVEKDNIAAINCLGTIYEQGKYRQKNTKKAFTLFKLSAEKNDAEGLYKIGQFLEKGVIKTQEAFPGVYFNRQAEIKGAMDYYQRAAKLGHLDAITDLGYIYEIGIKNSDGYYVEPNTEYAEKYYQKAKKQNFPRALNNLAVFYLNHTDFPEQVKGQNNQKAFKYLQKAAQAGYPKAYSNLAKIYQSGQIVPANKSMAIKLYTQGAAKKDLDSKLGLALSSIRDNINDDKKIIEAAQLLREILSEDKDNAEAKYYLGILHEKGIGVNKDSGAAYNLVQSAAKLGYPSAINKLADYHFSGFGCSKDAQQAISYYKKASSLGDTQALVNLGLLYEQGLISAPAGFDKAEELYQEATNAGNHNAALHLGLLNWHNRSDQNAAVFFKKASQMGNPYADMVLQKTQKAPSILSSNLKNQKPRMYKTLSSKVGRLNEVN